MRRTATIAAIGLAGLSLTGCASLEYAGTWKAANPGSYIGGMTLGWDQTYTAFTSSGGATQGLTGTWEFVEDTSENESGTDVIKFVETGRTYEVDINASSQLVITDASTGVTMNMNRVLP